MKIKEKLKKETIKLSKLKKKNAIKDLMKKALVSLMVTINLFFHIPTIIIAAENNEDKAPAIVPAAANEIISKYVTNGVLSGGSSNGSSGAGGVINSYEEKGDGWDSITEVTAANGTKRTYRNYKQYNNGNSYWNNSYWSTGEYTNIAGAGCGPSAVAIVLSGYGYDANPGDVVDVMHDVFNTDDSTMFEYLGNPLKYIGNIDVEYHYGGGTSSDISIIRENFKQGRPVIVNAPNHYVVYLGEDQNGNIIISDPGAPDGGHARYGATLEEVINNGNITCGYILITSDGNASSGNGSNSNNEEDSEEENNSEESNSEENKNEENEAKIDRVNISNGGYDAIFTSGTTGRQFKEYKQNSQSYNYPDISGCNCSWGSECGTVCTIIIGSGYSDKATIQDAADKLNNNNGQTIIDTFLRDYAGNSVYNESVNSKDDLVKKLKDGNVAVIHDAGYSSDGHYMAILDISEDESEVYLSNPDVYATGRDGISQGWNSIDSVYNVIDKSNICFVSNDGESVDYNADGSGNNYTSSGNSNAKLNEHIKVNNRDGYKLNINFEKEVKEMLEMLKKKDFDLKKYVDRSLQEEYLEKCLKAAIVTQYPDLRSAEEIAKKEEIPPDETQGCIKIKRYVDEETRQFVGNAMSSIVDKEDNGMYLSYLPYSEFYSLISTNDLSAINYFSLDSSNNIVVAGWEELQVESSIEQIEGDEDPNPDPLPEPRKQPYSKLIEKKINYLDQISNYTMPFSLLWTLTVYGNDPKFVMDLADLVMDTEIVIGCYDATSIKETVYTDTYVKKYTIETTTEISDGEETRTETTTEEKTCKYEVKEKHLLKTDTPTLKVKHADMWTAVYNNNYEVQKREGATTTDEIEKPDEVISTEENYETIEETNSENTETKNIHTKETVTKTEQVEKVEKKSTNASVQEIAGTDENVRMKIYVDAVENSFVKLLHNTGMAKTNLKSIKNWFFESVESTAAISNMTDLLKYLFNYVFNETKEYGDEELQEILDFFDPDSFSKANSGSDGNYADGKTSTDLISFLEKAEGGNSYIDGDNYIVYSTESVDRCLNIGHGVVVACDGEAWYPDILPNPYEGQVVSKEIYEKIFNMELKSKASNVDAALARNGVTFNQHQYDAMVSYCYNCGADLNFLISTYKNEGEEGLWREWQKYHRALNKPLLGLKRRRSEEYEMFTKGDYDYNPVYDGDRVKYY